MVSRLFEDDFSGSTSLNSWESHFSSENIFRTLEGALVFLPRNPYTAWESAIAGDPEWKDYRFSFSFVIHSGGLPSYKSCGARLSGLSGPGYDVGGYVRYQSEKSFYRVQFSVAYQEVALAKGDVGVVAVAPCEVVIGKTHSVQFDVIGDVIRVIVDGQETIRYRDECFTIPEGRIGLCQHLCLAHFFPVTVETLRLNDAEISVARRGHHFHIREWLENKWIFDGQEPIAKWGGGPTTFHWTEVRLAPGYRGCCRWYPYWNAGTGWCNQIESFDATEERDGFSVTVVGTDTERKVRGTHTVKPLYDASKRTYVYESRAKLEILGELSSREPEVVNFLALDAVGCAVHNPEGGDNYERKYYYSVHSSPDGKLYRDPLNHSRDGKIDCRRALPPHHFLTYTLNEKANPTIEVQGDPALESSTVMCHWAYDWHMMSGLPEGRKETRQPGEVQSARFRIFSTPYREAKQLMEKASPHPAYQGKEIELPVFQIGMNRFDRGRKITEPHDEYLWNLEGKRWDGVPVRGGVWDRETGRTVPGSIRLTARQAADAQVAVFFGSSYYMGSFTAPTYEISCWIKGEKATRGAARLMVEDWRAKAKKTVSSLCLDGAEEWGQVKAYSPLPHETDICTLQFQFKGKGRVWFDDLCIRPQHNVAGHAEPEERTLSTRM